MERFTAEELNRIARVHGLNKLCCREDRQMAERLLPMTRPGRQRFDNFFEALSWDQLIGHLHEYAKKLSNSDPNDLEAAYFERVCNILSTSQLRDSGLCEPSLGDGDSVMAWRMGWICAKHGLAAWWNKVELRLGCGTLVFLVGRAAPYLHDELSKVTQQVPYFEVGSTESSSAELQGLLGHCDVLYIAGKHDKSLARLQQLDVSHVTLVVLNVCTSGKLAKEFVARGVRQVVYWPTFVHDVEAVNFGVAFVGYLFEDCIEDAFSRAKQIIGVAERGPCLLSLNTSVNVKLQPIDVILEHRKAPQKAKMRSKFQHVGKQARVLPHTVLNGWVQVSIDELVIPWRVGHWRELSTTNRKTHIPVSVKSPHPCIAAPMQASAESLVVHAVDTEQCADTLPDWQDTQVDDDSQEVPSCAETQPDCYADTLVEEDLEAQQFAKKRRCGS